MKVFLLLFTSLLVLANGLFSQDSLRVTTLGPMWPDTVAMNSTVSFDISVQNMDSMNNYAGPITIEFELDTGGVNVFVDSVQISNTTIAGGATATFTVTHQFSALAYSPGNNVVVIWPISGSGDRGISLETDVFITVVTDVNEYLSFPYAVYPNPFNETLNIQTHGERGGYKLFSLDGRLICAGVLIGSVITVNDIAKGTYVLQVKTDSGTWTQKVIKD